MYLGKRKFFGTLLALTTMLLLFSMPIVAGFAAANISSGGNQNVKLSANTIRALQTQLNGFMKDYTRASYWKLVDLKTTLISQEGSGAEVAVTFDVERIHRVDYAKADDAPVVKGRLAFMKDNAKRLSEKQLKAANQDIEMWRHDLNEYITTDQFAFNRVKITATLDSKGMPLPGTVKFYSEGILPGDFALMDLNEFPSPQQVEKEAYDALSRVVKEANTSKSVSTSAVYNRLAARDYANSWTSNTSARCTSNLLQNTYYYNPAYQTQGCADCANYASQSMYAGGIPTSSSWQPYTTSWIRADSFITYMVLNGYMTPTTNINECVAGYPFGLFNSSGVCTHVMIMVSNDGVVRKFSAHTNDRLQYTWSSSLIPSGYTVRWYKVTY